jgi:hypothetical protein
MLTYADVCYAGTVRESGGMGSQSGSGWQGSDSDSDDDDKWNHKKRGTRTLGGHEPPSHKAGAWEGKSAGEREGGREGGREGERERERERQVVSLRPCSLV